jgi:hypothetical protein
MACAEEEEERSNKQLWSSERARARDINLKAALVLSSVSTGKPFRHSRESGNANSIYREFPGSRELICT